MRKRTKGMVGLLLAGLLMLGTAGAALAAGSYTPTEAEIPVSGTGVFLLKEQGAADADAIDQINLSGSGSFSLQFDEPGDYGYEVFSQTAGKTARYSVIVHVTTDGTWSLENAVVIKEKGTDRKVPACQYPDPLTIDPPVSKKVTGDTPPTKETFVFLFKGVSTTAEGLDGKPPMPAGSTGQTKKLTIAGAGQTEAGEIRLDRPGTYVYEFTEEKGTATGYTYDTSVYRLTVKVTETEQGLVAEQAMTKNGSNQEKIEAAFTNEYHATTTPSIGDENRPMVWVGLMGCSLLMLAVLTFAFPRKKRDA